MLETRQPPPEPQITESQSDVIKPISLEKKTSKFLRVRTLLNLAFLSTAGLLLFRGTQLPKVDTEAINRATHAQKQGPTLHLKDEFSSAGVKATQVENQEGQVDKVAYASIEDVLGPSYEYYCLNDLQRNFNIDPNQPSFLTTSQMKGEGFSDEQQSGSAHWWEGEPASIEDYTDEANVLHEDDGVLAYEPTGGEIFGFGANVQQWFSVATNGDGENALVFEWDNASYTYGSDGKKDEKLTLLPRTVLITVTTKDGQILSFEVEKGDDDDEIIWQIIMPLTSSDTDAASLPKAPNIISLVGVSLEDIDAVVVALSDNGKTLTFTNTRTGEVQQ